MKQVFAAASAAVVVMASHTAVAQEVTLSSPGGGVEISGRLLGYDGEFYRIDSVYGVLTVDANGVVCTGTRCPGPGPFVADLMFSGAGGTSGGLMPRLLEAFARQSGYEFVRQEEGDAHFLYVLNDAETGEAAARIRFRETNAAEGFADLLAETADVALAFREPTPAEVDRALEAGLGDLTRYERSGVLALDAFVPVVAPSNPVASIRLGDLALVLAGKITSWETLGGPDAPIRVHLPAPGQDVRAGLSAGLLQPKGLEFAGATSHISLESLELAILADPTALGVTVFSALTDARALSVSGTCGAEIAADTLTIKTEDYPLTAPHFYYTPNLRAPQFLRDFLAFVRSPAAQAEVHAAGFVDKAFEFRGLREQGERLAKAILATGRDVGARDLRRMVRALDGSERMSLSLRFEDGSADLDAPSRANVAHLATALSRGEFDGSTVILAGFSDGQGSGTTNLDLSRRRAEAVLDALVERMSPEARGVALVANGFGEAMPMACDEEDWGRRINRRVEVWVRRDEGPSP